MAGKNIVFGTPLPEGTEHPTTVSMPTIKNVVQYEEGDWAAYSAMRAGYPRFFLSRQYQELCASYKDRAYNHECVWVFPSLRAARKCVSYLQEGEVEETDEGVALAILPKELYDKAKQFWQHTGLIVSSRQAEDILNKTKPDGDAGVYTDLKKLIADTNGADAGDVYVFPTGMAAIYQIYEIVSAVRGSQTLQLGFPYLDTLKIQQKFGDGARYLSYSPENLHALDAHLRSGQRVSGVFCEVPGNPLLQTIDLEDLTRMLGRYRVPLIIDDTLGPPQNIDLGPYADVRVTSLTKFFSGVGDVMGGSIILNPKSPHYKSFKPLLDAAYENLLYPRDAQVLLANGRGFNARMQRINKNALALVQAIQNHPAIDNIYCTMGDPDYEKIRKPDGGYGGLFSITFKDPEKFEVFYNAFERAKCPGLGYEFTTLCPYTLLAHYTELEWARQQGVSPCLIRVSVGAEGDQAALIKAFTEALDAAHRSASDPSSRWRFAARGPAGPTP